MSHTSEVWDTYKARRKIIDYETDQKEQDTEAVAGDKGDGGGDYIEACGPYCAVVHHGG